MTVGSAYGGTVFYLQINGEDRTEILTDWSLRLDKMLREERNGKCPVFVFCRNNQNEEPSPAENI